MQNIYTLIPAGKEGIIGIIGNIQFINWQYNKPKSQFSSFTDKCSDQYTQLLKELRIMDIGMIPR